ncbi:MAG: peptidylprolyl isomerase [Candidatus Zixiibacteriota bacterium]
MRTLGFLLVLIVSLAAFAQTDDVVAEVNGTEITKADFKNIDSQKFEHIDLSQMDQHMRQEILDELINKTLLYSEAKDANLTQTELYKEMMESYKKKALIETFIQTEIYPNIEVSEEEIQREYKSNWNYYKPERMKVAMIMAKGTDDISEALATLKAADFKSDENSQKNVDIYEEMHNSNTEFMINDIRKDEYFVKEIEGFWDAKPGDFIGPEEVHGEKMAFKVIERIPEDSVPLGEVSDEIKKKLKRRKLDEYIRGHAEELRKNATITIHNNVLNDM